LLAIFSPRGFKIKKKKDFIKVVEKNLLYGLSGIRFITFFVGEISRPYKMSIISNYQMKFIMKQVYEIIRKA
jgi:hypothetical protein